jgi:hypothetical protein
MFCFKCLKKLERAFPDGPSSQDGKEPRNGLIFSASGNYGSRIYDPTVSAPELVIWICDECVVKHKELVEMRRYAFVQTELTWSNYDPEAAHW